MMASTQNKTDDEVYYESVKQILEFVKNKDTTKNQIGKENIEPWMIGKEVKVVILEEEAEIIHISCCNSAPKLQLLPGMHLHTVYARQLGFCLSVHQNQVM